MAWWTFVGLFRGKATTKWPKKNGDAGQDGLLGMPEIADKTGACEVAVDICPTGAITTKKIDYGKCVNCQLCTDHSESVQTTDNWDINGSKKSDLFSQAVKKKYKKKPGFKRSLHIRHVDAGSCNGCESELKAMLNPFYDMERLGLFFTPSPRFADILLVTGPVTYNMKQPLIETYKAMPEPRWVMAVGTCAVSGGTNGGGYACHNGLEGIIPVDLYLPGCPPNPAAILSALLTFLDRRSD
jgi:Ni,Fe-hydrogenase III small subunit